MTTRRSHCGICGKRLSIKTPYGDIRWQPSHVDDHGIYYLPCYEPTRKNAGRKTANAGRGTRATDALRTTTMARDERGRRT